MRKLIFMCVIFSSSTFELYGQADTLVCYDCRSGQIDIISPPSVISAKNFDYTGWNYGHTNRIEKLDTKKPRKTAPNSGFTEINPAQLFFNINDYPICTTIKKFRYSNGSKSHCCSGTMIASNLVLTCAHDLVWGDQRTWVDSILVVPAYDNGKINPLFGSSMSKKFYMPKTYYDKSNNDIAMIEIYDHIGIKTGWIGMAFHTKSNFWESKVIHTFSYPAASDPSEPSRIFNGDTLYYRYGILDFFYSGSLGFYQQGYGGESGSNLFFTDNKEYYSFGICSFGTTHPTLKLPMSFYNLIDKGVFYAFKNIIENTQTDVITNNRMPPIHFILKQNFPNPFNSSTTIRFTLQKTESVVLKIYNLAGQEITTLVDGVRLAGEHQVQWDADGLPSGIYLARLQVGAHAKTIKMVLQK